MLKKLLFSFFIFLVLLLVPNPVFAAGEFATSYDVIYDVDPSGVTNVSENISLRNLTERFYASSFNITISATDIFEVSASDSSGALETSVNKEGTKTQITVKFTQEVVGKDKTYPWNLKFKSRDFAQNLGKVWFVSLPRIQSGEDLDKFDLTLAVPLIFGDPTSINPKPKSESEVGGKLRYSFTKDQLLEGGVSANFGTNQIYQYKLSYKLNNPGVLPAIARLPLPPDTAYQEVLINSILPEPESVVIDSDGNYIALFTVDAKENLTVNVNGLAKLYINPRFKLQNLSIDGIQNYTKAANFWEKDSATIKSRLNEIFKDKSPDSNEGKPSSSNKEKAHLIYKYVVKNLQYADDRLTRGDFERLGGLTALNNPSKALCSEFADLFITLARAAGIPSRMLTGFAYTSNNQLRPLSLQGSILHAWAEYFDPELGWVMVDPTWENTTGGVDYFSKFDLNHFVLGIRGLDSEQPTTAEQVDVKFSEREFKKEEQLVATIDAPSELFAGLPSKIKIKIENKGNIIHEGLNLNLSTSKIQISDEKKFRTPSILPFASLEYSFSLRASNPWSSYEDIIVLSGVGEDISKKIIVKPFFALKYLLVIIAFFIGAVAIIYFVILGLHIRSSGFTVKPPKVAS